MGVVIIPFDYEQLPDAQRKTIVPICIASVNRYGNLLAPIWFEQGVVRVQDQRAALPGIDHKSTGCGNVRRGVCHND